MKYLPLIAITILATGCVGKDRSTNETEPSEIKKEALPQIPDKVTKEFVMDLWSQPNDETDIIKEVKSHVEKSGIWKISRKTGPNKDQLDNNEESEMILKFSNHRYAVWKMTSNESYSYSAMTYDFEKNQYHWWEFGGEVGNNFSAEYYGKLLDGNLIEWESATVSYDGVKIKMKEISKSKEKIEMTAQISKDGEIIWAAKDFITWSEELPTEKEEEKVFEVKEEVISKELLAFVRDQNVSLITNGNKVVGLNLEGKELTSNLLDDLVEFKDMEFLILDSTNITDKGLKEIVKLSNLRALWLDFTEITDVGLAELANLKSLEDLDIEDVDGNLINGLRSIEKFPSLKSLELINNGIGDECIESLSKMKNLEDLWIIEGNNFSSKGLIKLKKALPKCHIH